MTTLKTLVLMLAFLLLAGLILYGVALLAEWAGEASRSDNYSIYVRTGTEAAR